MTPRMALVAALLCAALEARARTLVVRSGGSIRAALARASAGDTVQVEPGVYREGSPADLVALTVTIPGIRLVGASRPGAPVVLENAGAQGYGVWVSPRGSTPDVAPDDERPPCGLDGTRLQGFVIEGFTVRGFAQHGVHLACVRGFRIANNVSEDNHVYGLFPVVSQDGELTGNVVRGSDDDAGLYVGQSDRVVLRGNLAEDNLLGLEVENSREVSVVGNRLRGNTVGIIVDILPDKTTNTQDGTLVALNEVTDNNRPNNADEGILAVLPAGIGILIAGGDRTSVTLNDVERNGFLGVGVVSYCLAFAITGAPECPLGTPAIEPNPDGNRIILNRVLSNGTVPSGTPADALLGDLAWDGSGTGNCWSANRFATSVPPALPGCF